MELSMLNDMRPAAYMVPHMDCYGQPILKLDLPGEATGTYSGFCHGINEAHEKWMVGAREPKRL